MAFSDYGVIIKKNGEYMTDEEIDQFCEDVDYDGHGACGTKEFYVAMYKTNIQIIYKEECIFSRYDRYELDDVLKIGEVVNIPLSTELNGYLQYFIYGNGKVMCSYVHPFTNDIYEVLLGVGVGSGVYDWWKNFLGIDDEELKRDCVLEF